MSSFKEIEDNLSKTMVPPLDSYVVDDGFVDWSADFWEFNEKFPEELYPAASIAKKFSSEFGLWNGPRGGYHDVRTPRFGKNMEKAGTGGYNRAARDVCVSSTEYIKNITDYDKKNIFIRSLIPFYSKISNKQLIIEAIKVTIKTFKDEKINEEKIINWLEFIKIQHPYLNTYKLFENPDEYVQII